MDSLVKGGPDGDFTWEDYLEEKGSKAAPPTAFQHIEHSLANSFNIGMKLEVPNFEDAGSYWLASVIMTCGPLLSLRYLGYDEDRSADFWFDANKKEFHPVGWCKKNGGILFPPKAVRDRCPNFEDLLTSGLEIDGTSNPLLNNPESCMTPVDQIKVNMVVEIWEQENYLHIWPATIIQNVGGRLLLRYYYALPDHDFWLFYLHERVHPVGWAANRGINYVPPIGKGINIDEQTTREMEISLSEEKEETRFPEHVLEPQLEIEVHEFTENMKLEILNPLNKLSICIGTITKVLNDQFFIVDVDTLEDKKHTYTFPSSCCHSLSSNIFPCGWAEENGLSIECPDGYDDSEGDFDWKEYLQKYEVNVAPKELFNLANQKSEFEPNAKLEAASPFFPDQIHVATVQKVVEPLLWIRMDNSDVSSVNHITMIDCFDIFPVGWCASNSYPLETPSFTKICAKSSNETFPKENSSSSSSNVSSKYLKAGTRKAWCPKIYFNHWCFSGPYLSKSRLAELPQGIGPGPVDLVMKDVLTRLINIAYKSSQVLRELQISGKPKSSMVQQTIKAKYKGKSFRAIVEFVRNSEQVEEFCRQICLKLDCCPNLFGPTFVGKNCPENCHSRTKTTFTNGFLKNKKKEQTSTSTVTATGEDNLKQKAGPGRKKKKKHWRSVMNENNTNIDNESTSPQSVEAKQDEEKSTTTDPKSKEPTPQTSDANNSASSDHEVIPIKRKRKKLCYLPKSDIVTRGAKTPKFWRHHSASTGFLKRRGRPPSRHISVLQTVVKKKGRPLGSSNKNRLVHVTTTTVTTVTTSNSTEQENYPVLNNNSDNIVVPKEFQDIKIEKNPMKWTIDETIEFIKKTSCASVAPLLKENEIDGQAFLLLDMPFVTEYLRLKAPFARQFCSLIALVKYKFFNNRM